MFIIELKNKNHLMHPLKPNAQRAKIAIILIWIVFSLEILALVSGYLQYDLLKTAEAGGSISDGAAASNDLREQIIGLLYLGAYLTSGVTFILWFRRAYFNLHLRAESLSFTEGWAAGCWFVPFINLVRPYRIMQELYQETDRILTLRGLSSPMNLSTRYLGLWWALWIINNVIGQVVFRTSMKADTMDDLLFSTMAGMAGNIAGIPLALITVKIISDYASAEPLLETLPDSFLSEARAESTHTSWTEDTPLPEEPAS